MIDEELHVQDYVSCLYEEIRYQKPYSRLYHEWWIRKMLAMVTARGRVLDNGCGTGIVGEAVRKEVDTVVGLDISENMLNHARSRMDKVVLGDSQCMPFEDESFDLVIARGLLHHLPRPLDGIKEMARVLKDCGEIIIADTNRSLLNCIPRLIAKRSKHFSCCHKNMSRTQLIKMLSQFFNIEDVYFFGYLAYPIGFPDLLNIGKYLPFSVAVTKMLLKFDELISRIPFVRNLAWGIMIKGSKKRAPLERSA